ncbi:hypothetical protein HPB48_025272 [Haemaphysalis longicornis]|uniref:Uncharacterized protein n=1 Tax=Haemaphysalis longicornis TaxID=44386 RepID=A0A9J6H9C6_HAELO|nr:hypothetical protein HPB48_025272 [Haemaphysalis longicornis]
MAVDLTLNTVLRHRTDLDMDLEENRLASFAQWPLTGNCKCTPERMAEAGFYHCPTENEPGPRPLLRVLQGAGRLGARRRPVRGALACHRLRLRPTGQEGARNDAPRLRQAAVRARQEQSPQAVRSARGPTRQSAA